MILSNNDKYRFNDAMKFFSKLLQKDIDQVNGNVELKLLSFGIPIDNEMLYFDFPYEIGNGVKVDELNKSLKQGERFDGVDTKMYDLLESLSDEVKYIAYNYDEVDRQITVSSDFKIKLNKEIISSSYRIILDFFSVMYFSAFPDKWPGANLVNEAVKVSNDHKFSKWFIVIHNENINDSSNTIISNYCLLLNDDIEDGFDDQLLLISNKLQDFSKYYGTKDFNVIIRKNSEFSDSVLSLNSEIYHHIKELHSNFSKEPIRKLKQSFPENIEIDILSKNAERIETFYDHYVTLLKGNKFKKEELILADFFGDPDFISFKEDLSLIYHDFELDIFLNGVKKVKTIKDYFNIIIKEGLLNAIKAFISQGIVPKRVEIHCQDDSNGVIVFNMLSEKTVYKRGHKLEKDSLGCELIEPKAKHHQTGFGLVLTNNLLKKMDAVCYDEVKQKYILILDSFNKKDGFTLQFKLPKLI